MLPTEAPAALPEVGFEDAQAWWQWLELHHAGSAGVWMRLAKKASGVASVSYPEALDAALCFGWIDGLKKSAGEQFWLQKFTPRARRSIWSKVNRDKALALEAAGRMQPAGRQEIERAQQDGRWEAAYDSSSSASVPEDLQAALDAQPQAKAFFATLKSHNRYAILFRIQTAKKAETRARRIEQFVAMLVNGDTLHP
ncbi:MAG: YdeI/OmpD-associated family protein [Pseudomonadota bacterium]